MVNKMGLQAPFISSQPCSARYQTSLVWEPQPAQVRAVPGLLTLGLLSPFKVRRHNIRILAPIPALHDNTL